MDTSEGQSSSAPATAKGLSEPSMLVKACQCLESNGKVLTGEAKMHITSMMVKCSCIQAILELRHPRSCTYRAKSWELIYNYPAISFMLNGV